MIRPFVHELARASAPVVVPAYPGLRLAHWPLALLVCACGSPDTGTAEAGVCGPHGSLHSGPGADPHCHCDEGYAEVETMCVPEDSLQPGATGPDLEGHGHPTGEHESRLVIADAVLPQVHVVSLESHETLATFPIQSPARVYTTESGRFAAVVQYDGHRADFIDSGLALEEHGDHVDPITRAPQMLPFAWVGDELGTAFPAHFTSHGGHLTLHFDGLWNEDDPIQYRPTKNVVMAESQLLRSEPMPSLVLELEAHHGVSVVTEDGALIVSDPSVDRERSTLPSGVTVRQLTDGAMRHTFNDGEDLQASCWGLHGKAIVGSTLLLGCHEADDGGVLVIEPDEANGGYISRKMTYPGYPEATAGTSGLVSHAKNPFAVGQWGTYVYPDSFYDGLVRIDPQATTITEQDTLDLGSNYCEFDFERADGELVVALTRDGKVHIVDVNTWTLRASLDVLSDRTEDGTCAGHLAVGEHVAYVSEQDAGTIFEIDLDQDVVAGSFVVEGTPGFMTVLGRYGIP